MAVSTPNPVPFVNEVDLAIDEVNKCWYDALGFAEASEACTAVTCDFVPCGPKSPEWTVVKATEEVPYCG